MPRNPIATRSAARTLGTAAPRQPGARQNAAASKSRPISAPRYSKSPDVL